MIQYISNFLEDENKKSVSYKKFRKILFNNREELHLTINELSNDEKEILNDFNMLRNWALHIPETLFIQKKMFFNIDSKFTNKK